MGSSRGIGRWRRLKLISLIAVLGLSREMDAQLLSTFEGNVLDPSDAPVAGASVRVVDVARNAERALSTNASGWFEATALAPGIYRIEAAKDGFRTEVREGIEVGAGRSIRLDLRLTLGQRSETVNVTGEAPLLDTASSSWGGSIARSQLRSLPLNGRDLFDLSAQQVGVTVPPNAVKTTEKGQGAHLSVNGSRPSQNGFRIDGIQVNDATQSAPASAAGLLLGLEGIAELRIVTSPFSAEYGRAAGGILTAVSVSGANSFQGSAFEYLRNNAMDARNYFDAAGQPAPPFRRNQFGGLLTGPIVRNRLFFASNYEGFREGLNKTTRQATLTEAARSGDLPSGKVTVAGEVKPYLKLYPLPNGRDFGDGTAEFIGATATRTREDYAANKLDLIGSERLRLSARHTYDRGRRTTREPFGVWQYQAESAYQFLHAGLQLVPSARTIHGLRGAFSRVTNSDTATAAPALSSELAYLKGQTLGALEVTGLPEIGGLSARLAPRRYTLNDYGVNYDGTHLGERHKLVFGAGYDRIQFNTAGDNSRNGFYRFSSVANFLKGITRSGELMAPDSDSVRGWRQHLLYAYVQDEMRLHRRLSLTVGVRWEPYSTPAEVNGKVATLPDVWHDAATTVGGPLFLNPSKGNFAPRLAVAWDVTGSGRTVVRAGAGIFYDLLGTRELVVAGFRMPPFFRRLQIAGAAFPNLAVALAGATVLNSVDGMEYRPHQPYVAQYQLSIEREVGRGLAAQIGYAGSRGVHLPGQVSNLNTTRYQIQPDGRYFFPANAPAMNPAFDQIGMRLTQFDSVYHALQASLRGNFGRRLHAQAKFAWAKSIDTNSSAIFADFAARLQWVYDNRQNRGPSDFDLKYSSAVNLSYDLPGPSSGRAGHLLGGWQAHGILQIQSGYPFSPIVGFDSARLRSSTADQGLRPDLAAPAGARIILGDPLRYFDPAAFSVPAAGYYGSLGRNRLRGPGLVMLSAAIHKTVFRNERHELRLRVEGFNLGNHPNFAAPSDLALFNSGGQRLGTAGRITATTTTARQIQAALRWAF